MIFGLLILGTALMLSGIAAFYSIVGLVAIFSAMPIPIIIMGGSLEIAKIVTTVFLHNNWKRLSVLYKTYLVPAVLVLMLLTSLGIFGLLSKAHSDQSLVSGDVQGKIAIYDEKIKTARENIEANRKQLKQMDEAVDQVMGRSTDEKGADKAVSVRKNQSRDRSALAKDIEANQKLIATLNDEAAPIRAEVRKVEAEVGPIKYIAALLYGDNPDANLLERAVRWMIIMIVLVFDPLALTLILAANKQFEWARQGTGGFVHDEPIDVPLVDPQTQHIQKVDVKVHDQPWHTRYPYLARPFVHFKNLKPMVAPDVVMTDHTALNNGLSGEIPCIKPPPWTAEEIEVLDVATDESEKQAIKAWKTANPDDTIKAQRVKLIRGHIDHLPWQNPLITTHAFGREFPDQPTKGDTYLKVDVIPSRLHKYNGESWIQIDKDLSDNYTYNTAYIDYLIDKIDSGEYDPDLLNELEQEQIATRLNPKL